MNEPFFTKTYEVLLDGISFNILIDSTYVSFNNKILGQENFELIHFHPYFEFFFASKDGIKIFTENEQNTYKNCFVIVPPYLKHYTNINGKIFRFHASIVKEKRSKSIFFNKVISVITSDKVISAQINDKILFYLQEIEIEFSKKENADETKVKFLLSLLVIEILKSMDLNYKIEEKNDHSKEKLAYKIEYIINREYKNDITLEKISKSIGFSTRQTSRIIKNEFNCNLKELINNKKLNIASMLLKNTNMSVKDIADEVNIENENYFYKLFKDKYNVTPNEYRKLSR